MIASRREGRKPAEWCSGPARMCKALAIDGALNGVTLSDEESPLWIEEGDAFTGSSINVSSAGGD